MLQLLSATPSPFARKVRMVLHEKSIDFELITEVPWNREASAPQQNPLGKIPVLTCDDGSVYYESAFIVEYLELTYPKPALLPSEITARLRHRRWEVLSDGLCDALVLMFIEKTREPGKQSERWTARQQDKVDRSLAAMAGLLEPDWAFTGGNEFGLADIALACTLGYLDVRFPQIDWRGRHPLLVQRFDQVSARESFRLTVPVPQTLADPVV